jgi:acyl-coenzyme A synthetase/AMP-(fatty) acid ligase
VDWEPIRKNARRGGGFNLADYDLAVREFSWGQARAELDGLPGRRGLNIAYEAVDRHAAGARRNAVALRCVAKDDTVTDITYAGLARQTSRFANVLRSLGVGRGERVFSLLPRLPELYVAALGTLKNASVFSPLSSAFGPEPIRERMRIGDAKVLVTALLERGEDGRAKVTRSRVHEITRPGIEGELALRPGWPSMFRGYLHDRRRYAKAFAGGWYLTGDVARRDADGYYWFVARADDVIKSAGHLIGPFEVESLLMEHPAVAEAGVIGKPDPVAGEIVKAFVALKPGREPSEELRRDLVAFARRRLGAMAPKEIEFDQHLPLTRSGKVMRRLLKARELGLETGDVSTLEGTPRPDSVAPLLPRDTCQGPQQRQS